MLEYFSLEIRSLRMLVCGTGRLYIGVLIMHRRKNAHGTGEAWNRG